MLSLWHEFNTKLGLVPVCACVVLIRGHWLSVELGQGKRKGLSLRVLDCLTGLDRKG